MKNFYKNAQKRSKRILLPSFPYFVESKIAKSSNEVIWKLQGKRYDFAKQYCTSHFYTSQALVRTSRVARLLYDVYSHSHTRVRIWLGDALFFIRDLVFCKKVMNGPCTDIMKIVIGFVYICFVYNTHNYPTLFKYNLFPLLEKFNRM